MRSVLVTGSSGYIGQALIQALVGPNPDAPLNKVFGLSRQGDPQAKGWRSIAGDIQHADLPMLLEELQPDTVFHTVAADRLASLAAQLNTTVLGTEHLLKSLIETQIPARVIVLGSAAEYGLQTEPVDEMTVLKPQSEYGIAKMAQTQLSLFYHRQFHQPVTVARVFNVYGKGSGAFAIGELTNQIARLEHRHRRGGTVARLKVKNLLSRRDFIYIDDVVSALIMLSENGRPGEIYNVASGQAVPLQGIVEKLLSFSTLKEVEILPQTEQISELSQGRINKINIHTGWKPQISLEEGLRRELQFRREQMAVLAI